MKLSVIIPTYQDDPRPAIASVLHQQGYDANEVEIIVCSDDPTCAIEYKGARTLATDVNTGPGGARQRGLDAAQGEYVTFIDADDIWFNLLALELFNRDVYNRDDKPDIASFNVVEQTKDGNLISGEDNAGRVYGIFYRRQFLVDNNVRFSAKYRVHEDVYFRRLLALKPAAVLKHNDAIYYWRYNHNSVVRRDGGEFWQTHFSQFIEMAMDIRDEILRHDLHYSSYDDIAYFYTVISRADEQYWNGYFETLRKYRLPEWIQAKEHNREQIEAAMRYYSANNTLPLRVSRMTLDEFFDRAGI